MSNDSTTAATRTSVTAPEATLTDQPSIVTFDLPVGWHVIVYVAFYGTDEKQVTFTGNGQTQVRRTTQPTDLRRSYMTTTNSGTSSAQCQLLTEWFGPSATQQVITTLLFDIDHPQKNPVAWEAEEFRVSLPSSSDEDVTLSIVLQEGAGPLLGDQ